MEFNDIYDADRKPTGRVHRRGKPWKKGEYGLVVCVWVYNDEGQLLLTRRAPGKTYHGTWENSGGAAKAGETSRQAICRELFEETGIRAEEEAFVLIDTGMDQNTHYDFYCLQKNVPLEDIVLMPGETDDVQWATFQQVHELVEQKKICNIISRQFLRQERMLLEQIRINTGK